MSENQIEGQIKFADYFKPPVKEKPIKLVDYINGMGTCQYNQIKDTITKLCEREEYDLSKEAIDRITNSVSIWLLKIGTEYDKYLAEILK